MQLMSTFKVKNAVSFLGVVLCTGLLLASCDDSPAVSQSTSTESAEYGIWVNIKTDQEYSYLLTVSDLMKDTVISPVNSGIDATGNIDGTYGTFKSGYYYTPVGSKISKMQVKGGQFVETNNCIINDGSYFNYMSKTYWNEQFNVLSWGQTYVEAEKVIKKNVYRINADDMTLLSQEPLTFPVLDSIKNPDSPSEYLPNKDLWISPTSFTIKNGKVFVGFMYWNFTYSIHTDKTYMLVCDYPSMENATVLTDDRYGYTSGSWWMTNSSFIDSKGDLYFTTTTDDNKYTILRIKSDESVIDKTYAFSLSDYDLYVTGYGGSYDHHTYIKDGLALMGSYIVDVWNQKVVADLNSYGLGKVESAYSGGILVNDEKLYVVIKTSDSRWFICRYNPDDKTLTRGLEIVGGVTQVGRIDKLK